MRADHPPHDDRSLDERKEVGDADVPPESLDPAVAALHHQSNAAFHHQFRQLRKRLAGKQLSLVQAGLMCSEAAISLWESGRRIPSGTMFRRIARVFEALGATHEDILSLRATWTSAMLNGDGEHR